MTLAERMIDAVERMERLLDRMERGTYTLTFKPPEPMRRMSDEELRFLLHTDEHGCARDGRGFAYCEVAMELFRKLPTASRSL